MEEVENETLTVDDQAVAEQPADESCVDEWKCLDDSTQGHVLADCSVSETKICENGCEDNRCVIPEGCEPGWKCIDESRKAYQEASCRYINKQTCDWKCEDSQCVEKPANYTEPVEEQPPTSYAEENQEPEEAETSNIAEINQGETQVLNVGGKQYNLTLYFITETEVKLDVDGVRSDWLMDGDDFVYQDIRITVRYILFQSYPGGKKIVGYSVGSSG
ncbi:hypothetical protein COV20_03135 [Candidatus Woesearchaeota archaeon CG10_big_fil_rev_8_21_14_0_10_45_16]|nr:MAG: hypothetical protein COV20_03135 [Candidatus Woesearchaeota archaeon CG10_big_fil_rev_8_21_14_0_10_45_16]